MKLFLSPVKLIFITSLSLFLITVTDIRSSIPSEKSSLIFIGNSGIPKDELTQSDITNIFLGAKKNWNNGHKIIFVSLREGEAHKKFLRTYLNMTVREYETYWRQKLFSGKGKLPKFCSTDAEAIDYVSRKDYAIGYISKDSCMDEIENFCAKDVIIISITE